VVVTATVAQLAVTDGLSMRPYAGLIILEEWTTGDRDERSSTL
jgi:hypothetical protein